jgi:hypothetical protein
MFDEPHRPTQRSYTMLYFLMSERGKAIGTADKFPGCDVRHECRNDWEKLERAQRIAQQLNDISDVPTPYLAIDKGEGCYPRYDVIVRPQVGDVVSKGFNGDYYPCGKIESISDSLRVITARDGRGVGTKFYRVRESGTWRANRVWALCAGHIDERNPEF